MAPVVCALFLWLVPATTHADPIRITSGGATAYFFGDMSGATLAGADLRIAAEGAGSHAGGPGSVGTMGNLSGAFEIFTISGPLFQTVNGETFRALLDGDLAFTTEPFLVQPAAGGNGSQVTFRVPFSMTGTIQGYEPTGPFGRQPGALLFNVEVFGAGTASQTKTFNNGFYGPPQAAILYQFEDAAASPTPEPASLLLIGTGLAGLLAQRRRTRTRQGTE